MPRTWYWIGASLAWANVLRHRVQGYRTPRTFNTEDTERSADYVIKVVDRWIERTSVDPSGKAVLELGPGPDLGTGIVLLARGARSYTAVDRFRLAQPPTSDAALPRRLFTMVGEADLAEIVYIVDDFPDLANVVGPFDLVVSNAVLEHVEDIPAVFRRLADLLADDGEMCHHVDPRTHTRWLRERDPWNILRYEDGVYETMKFPGMLNRLLLSDYAAAASLAGFDVVRVTPGTTLNDDEIANLRPQLAPRFRARPDDDLRMASFSIRCKKAPAAR